MERKRSTKPASDRRLRRLWVVVEARPGLKRRCAWLVSTCRMRAISVRISRSRRLRLERPGRTRSAWPSRRCVRAVELDQLAIAVRWTRWKLARLRARHYGSDGLGGDRALPVDLSLPSSPATAIPVGLAAAAAMAASPLALARGVQGQSLVVDVQWNRLRDERWLTSFRVVQLAIAWCLGRCRRTSG